MMADIERHPFPKSLDLPLYMILCVQFLLFVVVALIYFIVFLYQLSFNAVSYDDFAFSRSSSMQDAS